MSDHCSEVSSIFNIRSEKSSKVKNSFVLKIFFIEEINCFGSFLSSPNVSLIFKRLEFSSTIFFTFGLALEPFLINFWNFFLKN